MTDTTNRKRQPTGITTGGQFATEPKTEAGVTLAPAVKTDAHGGFRLTKLRTMNGNEGMAFSATLTENGKPVAEVVQDGNGGMTMVHWAGKWRTDATERFEAVAAEHASDALEPEDEFIARLVAVEEMNRKRKPAFVFDGDDFWGEGEYREFRGTATREQVLSHLASPAVRAKNPRIWDKESADFISVDEALAKS